MIEQAPLFWSWLQDGASVYVCGDASRMAKDVHATLLAIVEKQAGMLRGGSRGICAEPQGATSLSPRCLLSRDGFHAILESSIISCMEVE